MCLSCNTVTKTGLCPELRISENRRFFVTENGDPFFWLGDTGWLLFTKLNREDAEKYFENRRQKGFNVIQAILIQNVKKRVFPRAFTIPLSHIGPTQMFAGTLTGRFLQEAADLPMATMQ